jgi:hypothetical protein
MLFLPECFSFIGTSQKEVRNHAALHATTVLDADLLAHALRSPLPKRSH